MTEGSWRGCLSGSRLAPFQVSAWPGGLEVCRCWRASLEVARVEACREAGSAPCRRPGRWLAGGWSGMRFGARPGARVVAKPTGLSAWGPAPAWVAASSHLLEARSSSLRRRVCVAPAAPWLYRKSASPPRPQPPNQKLGWRLASRSGLVCNATSRESRREAQSVARAGGDKRPARNPVQRPAPFQLSFQGNLNWRALAAPGRMLPRPLVRRLAWRRDSGGPCGVLVARLAGAVEGRLAAAWAPGQVGGTRPGWVLSR